MRQFRNADFRLRIGGTVGIIVPLALALVAVPVPSFGQQPGKVYRIGWLGFSAGGYETNAHHCPIKVNPSGVWQAWADGLREYGYVQGQNLIVECRWTEGQVERAPALAAELVSLNPDVLVAMNTGPVRAAKQATSTIPIIMILVTDPVGQGLIASLERPGGNITGLTFAGRELLGKHLQLLKEAVPTISRVPLLGYSGSSAFYRMDTQAAAQALDLTLQSYEVRDPAELEGVFTAMTQAQAEALLVLPHPFTGIHAKRIAELAAQSRLPGMYPVKPAVEAGGLMSYAVDEPALFRRLGFYVDKILKGAKPADLPVEQPTKFELVINLKTAKALGLTIPQSLLNRADEVIQ